MTAVDHAELGRTTYEANSKQFDIHPFFARSAKWDELPDETKAHYAMVERTVTAPLLSEIEGLKAADARLHAITKAGGCPKCELTKAQCADSIAEVEVGRRTQAPDSWRPDREEVARMLDPKAFDHPTVHLQHLAKRRIKALNQADRVLALRPQTAESGK